MPECPKCGKLPILSMRRTGLGVLYGLNCDCYGVHHHTLEGAHEGWEAIHIAIGSMIGGFAGSVLADVVADLVAGWIERRRKG